MQNNFTEILEMLHPFPTDDQSWKSGTIQLIEGGMNNRIYRVRNADLDIAVKWTIRDERQRAEREYRALLVMQQQHPTIAPVPLFFDQDRYQLPVVIQSWIEGTPLTMPTNDQEWLHVITHYCMIHSITPDKTSITLKPALVNAHSPRHCWDMLKKQFDGLGSENVLAMQELLASFNAQLPPSWPKTPIALCRVDANPANFIRQPNLWASVDWENSGWGDPAFEIAELLAHPSYQGLTAERRAWIIEAYRKHANDSSATQRITFYYQAMLIWWVLRLQRMMEEIPRGQDQRLVERPANWHTDMQAKQNLYYQQALTLINAPKG